MGLLSSAGWAVPDPDYSTIGRAGVQLSGSTPDVTPPVITGPSGATGATSSISIAENTTAVHTFTASETVTWDLNGGADVAFFTINASTGALAFSSAPNFEAPGDTGANNTYEVGVRATDGASNATTQTCTVTVTDVAEGGGSTLMAKILTLHA